MIPNAEAMMTPQKTMTGRAWFEMTLLALIWGGSFLAAAVALREVGVFTVVAHRVFWAMLILWFVVWLRGYALPRDIATWRAFLVMGILNNVLPFSLFVWGQQYIESGLVSILNAATAIFGVLVAAMVFADERLTTRKLAGVLIGFCGVVSTIGVTNLVSFDIKSTAQLAAVLATVCYAFASAWARRTMVGLPPEMSAAGMLTSSSLIMVPLALILEGVPSVHLMPSTLAALAFFTVIATAFAYLLYYSVLRRAGSGNLTLVTLMIPPMAILLGAVFLHERLEPREFLGFRLVALGLIVIDGRLLRLIRRGKLG